MVPSLHWPMRHFRFRQSASSSQNESGWPSVHCCLAQIPDAQFVLAVHGAPSPSWTQTPFLQLPRSQFAFVVQAEPALPVEHAPFVQRWYRHWSFVVQGRPPGAGWQKPGSTPAGSTQVRLRQSMSSSHGSPTFPTLQVPRPHTSPASQLAGSRHVSPTPPFEHF
jgi:hypothetical protein